MSESNYQQRVAEIVEDIVMVACGQRQSQIFKSGDTSDYIDVITQLIDSAIAEESEKAMIYMAPQRRQDYLHNRAVRLATDGLIQDYGDALKELSNE